MERVTGPEAEAEIVIVGAGPSGCTAAAVLAELGHEVLLIDKDRFPREKPCGDGILSPAVAAAEQLGLGELMESSLAVEAGRFIIGHRRQSNNSFTKAPGRPLPRCITRKEFDAALLSAAETRGASLLRARVDSVEIGATTQKLQGVRDGNELEVRAGLVIAADGATSRLRRVAKTHTEKPMAYAIRQYFRTERLVDPIFQVDLALELDGRILPGYGWVFPIDEYTANIGIGIMREPSGNVPSLRAVLKAYVEDLQVKGGRRYGQLDPIADPMGSPMGIRSKIEVADSPSLTLIGDAAGTTHPITGEGIAFAMRGAEVLAKGIHERSKRGGRARPTQGDTELWNAFPQIGVDISAFIRSSALAANATPNADDSGNVIDPFLTAVQLLMLESAYDTGTTETSAWSALQGCDPELGSSLERANDLMLERLSDPTPFVTEVIHTSIKSHLGPMYAAMTLAVTSDGDTALPSTTYEAGVAAEAVGVLPKLFRMLIDRARSKRLKVNNALAVLACDFAATRALTAAAASGPDAVTALARTCQAGCQGSMRDAVARFAADRSPQNWLEAAQETEGATMELATVLGSIVRNRTATEPLRRLGVEVGVAMRLAEEIVELIAGDELHPAGGGEALGLGLYSLPVLYAIEAEPSLSRLLMQHIAEPRDAFEIVAAVRESGGLARAISECAERTEAALSLADACGGGAALAALAALPAQYVSARVGGDALAHS